LLSFVRRFDRFLRKTISASLERITDPPIEITMFFIEKPYILDLFKVRPIAKPKN